MQCAGHKIIGRWIASTLIAVVSSAHAQMRLDSVPLQSRCRPHFEACVANPRLSDSCRAWQACEDYADLGTTIRRELRFHQLRQQPEAPTPAPETQRRVPPTATGDILPQYRSASQVRPEFERTEKPAEPAR
jgi:hypothetical protein